MSTINGDGLRLIQGFESCQLKAYRDGKGLLTIGWGCTHHVTEGMVITIQEAKHRLLDDTLETCRELDVALGARRINPNQYSAMASFLFNLGWQYFHTSTLLACVRMMHMDEAADEFLKWDKMSGVRVKGLYRRRLAERALFRSELLEMDYFLNDSSSADKLFAP